MKNKTSCKCLLSRSCEHVVDKQNDPLAGQAAPFKKPHITYPRNVGGPQGSGICCWREQQTPDRSTRGKVDRGFTLIELLVVVLIIGILASIALPQYKKAVEKSKAVQGLVFVKALGETAQIYYLVNGTYPTNFDEMSADIPWNGHTEAIIHDTAITDTRSNEDWSLQVQHNTQLDLFGIYIIRLKGNYAGTGFVWKFDDTIKKGIPLCIERFDGEGIKYTGETGSFCERIMGGTLIGGIKIRYYSLP